MLDTYRVFKKTGPVYVFIHPDYNFIPMKLKFYMLAEKITKKTIPNLELHHRICVKNYYKCESDTFFEIDRKVHKSVIQDWVSKFETYGTAVNLNKKSSDRFRYSGRPRTPAQQIVEMVQKSVERSPKRLLRRRSKIFELEHVNWQKSDCSGFEQISISYTDKTKANSGR